MKTITIFGSSFPKKGDKEYEEAYLLGKFLGENKFNICSGGYQGIMDAVSKGATEAGMEAIGVTVDFYNGKPSEFLTEIIECDSLFERIKNLVNLADGFIILNGGTGTLLELAVIWEYFNKDLIPTKPVAVHGKMWKPVIDEIENRIKLEKRREGLIKYFDDTTDCVKYLIDQLR